MRIRVEPLLRSQRELYDLGMPEPRFSAYLRLMTAGTKEAVVPLQAFNPMGKPHVATRLDELVALDAEAAAADAARRAERLLDGFEGELRVAIVLVDDLGGGWTNRYTNEASYYFEGKYEKLRDWAVVNAWTTETPERATIEVETLAAIYRTLHVKCFGLPENLRAMMIQEGRTSVFAGASPAALSDAELESARRILSTHADATHFPTTFACMYGDEPARIMGLPPLGLPTRAGFAVAHADARRGARPESFLWAA